MARGKWHHPGLLTVHFQVRGSSTSPPLSPIRKQTSKYCNTKQTRLLCDLHFLFCFITCPGIRARDEVNQKYNPSVLDLETYPFPFLSIRRLVRHHSCGDQFLKTIPTQILSYWPPPSGLWISMLAGVPKASYLVLGSLFPPEMPL